jgi:hypothetical protein
VLKDVGRFNAKDLKPGESLEDSCISAYLIDSKAPANPPLPHEYRGVRIVYDRGGEIRPL